MKHLLTVIFTLLIVPSAHAGLPQGTFSGTLYSVGDLLSKNITLQIKKVGKEKYQLRVKNGFQYTMTQAFFENPPFSPYYGTSQGRIRIPLNSYTCVGYPYISVKQNSKDRNQIIVSQTNYYSPEGTSEIGAGCTDAVDVLKAESSLGVLRKVK